MPEKVSEEEKRYTRRQILKFLGVGGVGLGLGALAGWFAAPPKVIEVEVPVVPPPPEIPTTPVKIGTQTFYKGPAAILAEPLARGLKLAIAEINAKGGLLGKRPIELLERDEGKPEDTIKEYRKLVEVDKIDYFIGLISSGNTPAVGPVAEEYGITTIFVDGCTDILFEEVVTKPRFIFRTTTIQSAEAIALAIIVALTWPEVRKIAYINPDYAYGRSMVENFTPAITKLLPDIEFVYEGWPKLFAEDFTPHITACIAAKPDVLVSNLWGGDWILFYKQALGYGLFEKMRVAHGLSHGLKPEALGPDHPEHTPKTPFIAGFHADYYFLHPPWDKWPLNKHFVESYYKMWGSYPSLEAEGAYASMYALKYAIEKAVALLGKWPDHEEVCRCLEGLHWAAPSGYYYYRPDNHQAYRTATYGFAKWSPEYGFNIATDFISIPIEKCTAPPGLKTVEWLAKWPKLY